MKIYAGIGSRGTPQGVLDYMERIAYVLAQEGYVLRSGAAQGADSAFEAGAKRANGKREIFIPWRSFSKDPTHVVGVTKEAIDIAARYHPAWHRLSYGVKKLMARNVMQVLGQDFNTPVDFIICWTKDGKASGGTGQALRIAADYNIPIYNMRNTCPTSTERKDILRWLRQ